MRNHLPWLKMIVGITSLVCAVSFADGYVRVGNGDDGSDLEGLTPIQSGAILEARKAAVALIQRLGLSGVRGLGALLPEVQNSGLFLAKADITSSLATDRSHFHSDMAGKVFARTFAQPYADTRFFPVATKLETNQLVALHIHEGLHRALPPTVRENEDVTSEITLAITTPNATQDQIRAVAERLIPQDDIRQLPPAGGFAQAPNFTGRYPQERLSRPSNVGYSLSQFFSGSVPTLYAIHRMHTVNSDLYPFGGADTPFGLGLQASVLEGARGVKMGPFGISARLRVWSVRDFDIGLWSTASLNVLSNEELKQSPFGRDIFTLGLSIRKTIDHFYAENFLSVSSGGESSQTIGSVHYLYSFGHTLNAKIRAGYRSSGFEIGGFLDLYLADYFKVTSTAFNEDTGRYRIFSVGPEASLRLSDVTLSVNGRYLVDASQSVNFDYLGNLLNTGAAQGGIGASVRVEF